MQSLLQLEKTLPDGSGEFEPLRDNLARRFVADAGKNVQLVIADVYLQRLDALVAKDSEPADALLLGWYYLDRKNMAAAARYFKKARDTEDSVSASQGLALVLIAGGDARQAEDVMYPWRQSSSEASATYFAAIANLLAMQPAPVIDTVVLGRIAAALTDKKEVTSAEEFGWHALSFKQPRIAAQWFRLVLDWKADHEPAAYGLAVARLRLQDMPGVQEIQRLWAGRSDRISRVTQPQKPDRADALPSPDSVVEAPDKTIDAKSIGVTVAAEPASVEQPAPDGPTPVLRPRRNVDEGAGQSAARRVTATVASRQGCRTSIDPEQLPPHRPWRAAGA